MTVELGKLEKSLTVAAAGDRRVGRGFGAVAFETGL